MDEFGIRPLRPTPRSRIELVWEDAHRNRDGDVLWGEILWLMYCDLMKSRFLEAFARRPISCTCKTLCKTLCERSHSARSIFADICADPHRDLEAKPRFSLLVLVCPDLNTFSRASAYRNSRLRSRMSALLMSHGRFSFPQCCLRRSLAVGRDLQR